MGCFHQVPPYKTQAIKKDSDSQRQWMIPRKQASRHSRSNAHTSLQRLAACTQPAQVQVKQGPSTEREVDRTHTLNQDATGNCQPLAKGKPVFSSGASTTRHVNHTAGQVLCRGVIKRLTQNEQINSVDFFFFFFWFSLSL